MCEVHYPTRRAVQEHLRSAHSRLERDSVDPRRLPRACTVCHRVYHTSQSLQNHQHSARHYGPFVVPCQYCHLRFISEAEQQRHMNDSHFDAYTLGRSAFNGMVSVLSRRFAPDQIPTVGMLAASQVTELTNMLNSFLNRFNSVAVHLTVFGRFAQYNAEGEEISRQNIPMRSNTLVLHSGSRHLIPRQLSTLFSSIEDRVETLQLFGSGYSLVGISAISVNIGRRDYAGSSNRGEMFISHLTRR